jgi:hypothetical protein
VSLNGYNISTRLYQIVNSESRRFAILHLSRAWLNDGTAFEPFCIASGISIIFLFMSEIAPAYFQGSIVGMGNFLSNVGYFHSRSMGVLRLPGD